MSEENSSTQKSTKISLTGDIQNCGHCATDDKRFKDLQQDKIGLYSYEYTDVNSEAGQQKLKEYGVQEGQKIDIPITKIESCSWDSAKPNDKKCKTSDWKDEYWTDLEKGKLPE